MNGNASLGGRRIQVLLVRKSHLRPPLFLSRLLHFRESQSSSGQWNLERKRKLPYAVLIFFFCLFSLCHCALLCFIAITPRSLPIYSQASSACCLYNCRISRRRLTFLQSIVPNSVPSIAQNVCESLCAVANKDLYRASH